MGVYVQAAPRQVPDKGLTARCEPVSVSRSPLAQTPADFAVDEVGASASRVSVDLHVVASRVEHPHLQPVEVWLRGCPLVVRVRLPLVDQLGLCAQPDDDARHDLLGRQVARRSRIPEKVQEGLVSLPAERDGDQALGPSGRRHDLSLAQTS